MRRQIMTPTTITAVKIAASINNPPISMHECSQRLPLRRAIPFSGAVLSVMRRPQPLPGYALRKPTEIRQQARGATEADRGYCEAASNECGVSFGYFWLGFTAGGARTMMRFAEGSSEPSTYDGWFAICVSVANQRCFTGCLVS